MRFEAFARAGGERSLEIVGDELDELAAGEAAVHMRPSRETCRCYTDPP